MSSVICYYVDRAYEACHVFMTSMYVAMSAGMAPVISLSLAFCCPMLWYGLSAIIVRDGH